jgi:hypothetical protein
VKSRNVRGGARRIASGATAGIAVLSMVVAAMPAQAAVTTADSRRFNDGLDSRWSAHRLAQSAQAVGYASAANNAGRSANEAWVDGLNSTIFGLFGHANAGVFQVNEGATDNADQFLAGGLSSDVVSPYTNIRFLSEYLPYVDVDDMRILVLAGCYTANGSSTWGNMPSAAIAKGVDATISFPGLVYFPKTAAGTSISTTNYSGNYFWDRFSAHSQGGATVSTALSRAVTDLVNKEGSAGGWDQYRVRGAVASPGSVRMTPVGTGQPLNSKPLGVAAYESFVDLTAVESRSGTSGDEAITEITTAEGVLYRLRADGTVLDATAEVAAVGDVLYTGAQAHQIAETFARRNTAGFDGRWELVSSGPVNHFDEDVLWSATWRLTSGAGLLDHALTLEVDRRTGAVTYFADARADRLPGDAGIDAQEAVDVALTVADGPGKTQAQLLHWGTPRWLVTVDRGLEGDPSTQTPDLEQVLIDARSGAVLATTTT